MSKVLPHQGYREHTSSSSNVLRQHVWSLFAQASLLKTQSWGSLLEAGNTNSLYSTVIQNSILPEEKQVFIINNIFYSLGRLVPQSSMLWAWKTPLTINKKGNIHRAKFPHVDHCRPHKQAILKECENPAASSLLYFLHSMFTSI